jgi:hypothetical protein
MAGAGDVTTARFRQWDGAGDREDGQLASVSDQTGAATSHALDYSQWPERVTESVTGLFSKEIVRDSAPGGAGSPTGLSVTGDGYDVLYDYDAATGRTARVRGPGLPAGTGDNLGAYYTYHDNSDLVHETQVRNGSANPVLATARTYEDVRDALAGVDTVWDPQGTPVTIAHYGYTSDPLGRRTAIGHSGIAFGGAFTQTLGYNDRNELTSSTRSDGGVYASSYTYDPIGNRSASSKQDPPVPSAYFSNGLDQYYRVETQGGSAFFAQGYHYDADGNLSEAYVAADMNP